MAPRPPTLLSRWAAVNRATRAYVRARDLSISATMMEERSTVYLALDAFHGLGVQAHLIEERLEETNGLPIGTLVALLRDRLDAQELLELLHTLLLLSRPLLYCLSFHLSRSSTSVSTGPSLPSSLVPVGDKNRSKKKKKILNSWNYLCRLWRQDYQQLDTRPRSPGLAHLQDFHALLPLSCRFTRDELSATHVCEVAGLLSCIISSAVRPRLPSSPPPRICSHERLVFLQRGHDFQRWVTPPDSFSRRGSALVTAALRTRDCRVLASQKRNPTTAHPRYSSLP